MSEDHFIRKPVDDNNFWRKRIYGSIAHDRPAHAVIYDTTVENWLRIQQETVIMLRQRTQKDMSILDVGCGYGALYECTQQLGYRVYYAGLDYSTDLIELANLRHPEAWFAVADARELPYGDGVVDLVVCRSLQDMIIKNLGEEYWKQIYKELYRVARHKIILVEYDDILTPMVITK